MSDADIVREEANYLLNVGTLFSNRGDSYKRLDVALARMEERLEAYASDEQGFILAASQAIQERDNLQARLTVCNEERREQDRERDRLKDQLEQVWGERNVLKDQLAKSEQAREDAIIERAAEIGRLKDQLAGQEQAARSERETADKALVRVQDLKDQLAEQAKLVADTQSDLFRVSDKLAEADANGLRLAEKVEKYQAHIKSESSRLAQIDDDRERLREALAVYANPKNWGEDDWGVPRSFEGHYGREDYISSDEAWTIAERHLKRSE